MDKAKFSSAPWVIIVTFCLIIIFGYFLAETTSKVADDNARQAFITGTNLAALNIDVDKIKLLQGTESDVNTEQYVTLKNTLVKIKQTSESIHFVYLMGKRGDQIFFMVDAEPPESEDYSPPGQVYPDPSEELHEIFSTGASFVEGPIEDEWGTWVSGHAPIIDPVSKNVVAIIGMDVDASIWKETIALYRWGSIGIAALLALIAAIYFAAYNREHKITLEKEATARKLSDVVDELEKANKELDAFSYSVSHDLKGPLRSIDGFSAALEEDCSDSLKKDGLEYLARVRSSVKYMRQLIDSLLKLSQARRYDLKKEDVDLSELAKSIVDQELVNYPDHQPRIDIESDMRISGDPILLGIVLKNLISNAIKFTSKSPNPEIKIGKKVLEEKVYYYVNDNGVGFDMKRHEDLFKPLQRLHGREEFDGTGVGLSIVSRIVRRHGGNVWATSEVNKGSTFNFEIN